MKTISLVLKSTVFSFNDEFYKQKRYSDGFISFPHHSRSCMLKDLKEKALKIIDLDCNFYIKYVDDISSPCRFNKYGIMNIQIVSQ